MARFLPVNNYVSARRQIAIRAIRDDMIVLPNNQYRMIFEISPINFELRSETEQDAIIDSFQSFLNSLSFPIQFLSRAREVNIVNYLARFDLQLSRETNPVYRAQIRDYMNFVQSLVTKNQILSRKFYGIVSYSSIGHTDIDQARTYLQVNCGVVAKGLSRIGISCRILSSIELFELYRGFYHSDTNHNVVITKEMLQALNQSNLVNL